MGEKNIKLKLKLLTLDNGKTITKRAVRNERKKLKGSRCLYNHVKLIGQESKRRRHNNTFK